MGALSPSTGWTVSVPASSANLGPGFDVLGMALDLPFLLSTEPSDDLLAADESHPATKAYRLLGGAGSLWWRSPIPPGRGLGFSGAARVAGLALAVCQRDGGLDEHGACEVLAVATELEGHADNVAASLHGGVVASAAGSCVRVPLGTEPAVVAWVPSSETSTDESRGTLPTEVAFADAVFNVGRTALLVAALAAGDVGALRRATEDRLHQPYRLARELPSAGALAAALEAGAWCAWLSGSGPTVAALCDRGQAASLGEALPAGGRVLHLRIDHAGAVVSRLG